MPRASVLLAALLALPCLAGESTPLEQLWQRPKDIATRDVVHGWGGSALQPSSKTVYKFKSEDTKGHSKGYEVVDPQGRTWDVKIGDEAQSEFVLSRVLWAVGYRQPVMYYVPRWKMEGGPDPTPPPGRFRLQSDHKNDGVWEWRENPFVDTRALKGLIVINLLFNNWDLDESQNRVYNVPESAPGPTRWYVVQDLGAALGKSKMALGSRNDRKDFEKDGFIKGVEAGRVMLLEDINRATTICERAAASLGESGDPPLCVASCKPTARRDTCGTACANSLGTS